MNKKTISYTVGTDLASEVKVEHELYAVPVKHSDTKSNNARVSSKSKQRWHKKTATKKLR